MSHPNATSITETCVCGPSRHECGCRCGWGEPWAPTGARDPHDHGPSLAVTPQDSTSPAAEGVQDPRGLGRALGDAPRSVAPDTRPVTAEAANPWPDFWVALADAEIGMAAAAMPMVAGGWSPAKTKGGASRHIRHALLSLEILAEAYVTRMGNGHWCLRGPMYEVVARGGAATLDEAKAAADAALAARGVRIVVVPK